jgi:aryl-alcohol dehydrogenase-like predicted oxidoreductase
MKKNLVTVNGDPISRFCFGTMQFGGKADKQASRAMFEASLEAGINFFDTAYVYTEGRSEELLGEFAKGKSDDLFIATKCASTGGARRKNILSQFDNSRKRLGMDCVDLLYLHQWNTDAPLDETFETLAGLIEQGKTRYIGVSNFAAWQVMKAQEAARRFGIEIAMLQPMYNLVKRQVEVEILPMAVSEGFAVCPYSPLGGGLLTGKYAGGDTGRISTDKTYAKRYGQDWMHRTAADLLALGRDLGISPATLAVAWVAHNPAIAAPIISARSSEQLQPSLDAISLTLDADVYRRLSALSPTPAPATDRNEEV